MLGFLAMLEAQNHPSLLAFLGGVTICLALNLKKLEFCGSLPTFSATEMEEYPYYPAYVPSMHTIITKMLLSQSILWFCHGHGSRSTTTSHSL